MQYIEYVQTDGACWFDTGIIPVLNTEIELVNFWPLAQTSNEYNVFIGAANQDYNTTGISFRKTKYNTKFELRFGNVEPQSIYTYSVDTDYHTIINKTNISFNENTFSVNASSLSDACIYSFYIAAEHNNNGAFRPSTAKFGEIIIRENGVVVADLKPAINDSNSIGFYDTISQTFKANLGTGTPVAGPILSSIIVEASKTTLKNTGETINIVVTCENAWTVSQTGEWLTLSSAGDTGGTTITATAPSYSGATARETTITFTDSVTNDTAVITIKQKKYTSGQPFYLGADEIAEIYLGVDTISEAYLGEDLVYSSGPFMGLKINPKAINFGPSTLTSDLKIKSSESWTMTVPEWATASSLTGDTGETIVTLTTTAQTADTSGIINITTANYSASASCVYQQYTPVNYIHSETMGNNKNNYILNTNIYPTLDTKVELKFQYKGYSTGNLIVGMNDNDDSKDWRLFNFQKPRWCLDIGSGRINDYVNAGVTNTDYDFEFGNFYITNKTNSETITGATQTGTLSNKSIEISLGIVWINEVKIWQGETLVFDGKAAKLGNQYGLYDIVGSNFLTSNDFTIVGEE